MAATKARGNSQKVAAWQAQHPLERFRRNQGWTAVYFAGLLGVSRSVYSLWKAGSHKPSEEHAERIAVQMGITASLLGKRWDLWLRGRP